MVLQLVLVFLRFICSFDVSIINADHCVDHCIFVILIVLDWSNHSVFKLRVLIPRGRS